MVDMSQTIVPKSDQLNADDLIGGPRTITITRVTGNEGNAEQPVNVFYEGDNNKPFRPCKSMRRVMVKIWGADASQYVGKSMTLFRDPKVKWGGMEVGGIRISHMTGIDKPEQMALTETRAKRTPYTVHPLKVEERVDDAALWAEKFIANVARAPDVEKLNGYVAKVKANLVKLEEARPELHAKCDAAIDARRSQLTGTDDDDPFGDTSEPTPAEQRLIDLREKIEAADTPDAVDEASNEWAKHRVAYDDETIAEIDGLVSAAFKRVRGEGQGK